jgi:hypothetical protein
VLAHSWDAIISRFELFSEPVSLGFILHTLNNVNSIQTASERAHLDLTEAFESKERA